MLRAKLLHASAGIVLGLAASAVVFAVWPQGGIAESAPVGGSLLSDCDGPIRDLVIHYTAGAAGVVDPVYAEFLHQLPSDVRIHVVCPRQQVFEQLTKRMGVESHRLSPVVVDHPMTCWSRDRWLALDLTSDRTGQGRIRLCSPRMEQAADAWPDRLGDARTADDLAAALEPNVIAQRSGLLFDGGDFVADDETVFVTPAVLTRNVQNTVADRDELLARLTELVGRRVVLLDEAPPHHAGMFMMPVGDRTMLVGDPAAAEALLGEVAPDELGLPGGADFSTATQTSFDAVAHQCERNGYRVVRIPVVPAADGRTYLTYFNAILDHRGDDRIVYMPTFSQVPGLNESAAGLWRRMGYQVRPVPCDTCYQHYGSLRCLVNVLRRGSPS